jgi:hypothetical protein
VRRCIRFADENLGDSRLPLTLIEHEGIEAEVPLPDRRTSLPDLKNSDEITSLDLAHAGVSVSSGALALRPTGD